MSSYTKKRIDFSELDNHFEDDPQMDSLRYNQDIDSAVQVKKPNCIDRLHEVQQSLSFSPHIASEKKKLSAARCSFGANTHNTINPVRLQFVSGNNSVSNSLQLQSPSTASFPLQKKFLKQYHLRTSIEELSAENDVSEEVNMREQMKPKYNLSINTEEENIDDEQMNTYNSQGNEMISKEQLEEFLAQLITEFELAKEENQIMEMKLQQSQHTVNKLTKQNQELAQTLEETQKSLSDLADTNNLLKKKIQKQYNTSVTEHGSNRHSIKENNNDSNVFKEVNRSQATESSDILNAKKQNKFASTLQNVNLMLVLMLQKCFYLDEQIDREGREVCIKLVQGVNSKQAEYLVQWAEQLIKHFEQRFADMVGKTSNGRTMQSIMSQIQQLLNDCPK